MKWPFLLACVLLTLLLTACPAAETPGPGPEPEPEPGPGPGETVTQVGFVSFSEASGLGSEEPLRSGFAFFSPTPATPASDYTDLGVEDTCFVAQGSPGEPPTGEPAPAESLDAGEQITATSGGETYAVLEKTEEGGGVFYTSNFEQNLPPLPSAAFSVEVPGAAFPAFSADAPGAGAALAFTSPEDLTSITPASTFSWAATPVAGASTYVTLFAAQGLEGDDGVSVLCVLEDDGSFSFSAETQAEMQANGFTSGALTLGGRTVSRAETERDATLVVSVSRSSFYGAAQPLSRAQSLQLEVQKRLHPRAR